MGKSFYHSFKKPKKNKKNKMISEEVNFQINEFNKLKRESDASQPILSIREYRRKKQQKRHKKNFSYKKG